MLIVCPAYVFDIVKHLKENGHDAYIVGGAVRDSLLGFTPKDWDIATSANPDIVEKLFDKTIPVGKKYGTIFVKLPYYNAEFIEVTTFRKDDIYLDGRHPSSVAFSDDIIEDLSRRDLTINAIAYDPINDKIIDPYDGQKDLLNRNIRFVGVPKHRIIEDPLRTMRAIRFAADYNFNIDLESEVAICNFCFLLSRVSQERKTSELNKMLLGNHPKLALKLMANLYVLNQVLPMHVLTMNVEQSLPHDKDVWNHTVCVVDQLAKYENISLSLAGLFHDVGKIFCKTIRDDNKICFYNHEKISERIARTELSRMRYSNKEIEEACTLIEFHMFPMDMKKKGIRRLMRKTGDLFFKLMFLKLADINSFAQEDSLRLLKDYDKVLKKAYEITLEPLPTVLKIDGHDIMQTLDMPPSPQVGKIMSELADMVDEDPQLNERDTLLEIIKKWEKEV